MKRSLLSWFAAVAIGAAWLGSAGHLRSQTPGEAPAAPVTAVERLNAIKASNATLLEQQKKTLQKLDEINEQARQIRIMISRA